MERYSLPLEAADDVDVTTANLWRAGAVGVWERERELVAWFPSRGTPVPPGGTWAQEPDRDWTEAWKSGLEPVQVGAIRITPSWVDDAQGPTTVVVDPGMAFGTGHHATTRLCLGELQRVGVARRRVLDVGTGSGVLAIAAMCLGAASATAVDTDPEAVAVARSNARRNTAEVTVRVGSVSAAVRDGPFDVVVANLVTDAVLELAHELVAVTHGFLITSGISDGRADDVVARLVEAGAVEPRTRAEDGWVAVTAAHPRTAVRGSGSPGPPGTSALDASVT